ncbi:MAG: HAMP domain-containing sensor histidine kinase [Lentisphaeria bacterium]|nr:HAMP domain-containing sensor histidine kinase [Lentisphaeria bacterium]
MKLKLAALIMVLAAVALAAAAFRLARKESDRHAAGLRDLLDGRCVELAGRCADVARAVQRDTEDLLRDARPTAEDILGLERRSPFIRDVFFLDSGYAPVYPDVDSDFFTHYHTLFFERTNLAAGAENTLGLMNPSPRNDTSSVQRFVPGENDVQTTQIAQAAQTVQMVQAADARNPFTARQGMNLTIYEESAGSQFELLSRGRSAGWIPWVNQNQFMPLVWIKREDTGMIAGARIESAAVIARLIPLISVPGDGFFHIQLTDGNSKVMTGSGYRLNNAETAAVTVEISRDSLPGFQLRGFLNPAVHQRGNSLAMANILLVASLLLVVLTSAGVAFYFVNREMILAGKKTSFVANVSHELKTPLTSIRMYSEMLRENLDRLPVSKRDHYLKVIVSESERLTRLIANILDFNKMEAAEKQYHPRPVEVSEVVVETMKACDHLLADAGLRVELDVPDTDVCVLIDRDSLVQVIQNVVSNAVKYAKGADRVRVSVTSLDARRVAIDIADNGPGVPPRARRKLFRKFYRVDNDLTAATSGSGLGLTISRKLMRDQGGDVRFAPNPGGGAVFSITLTQPANGLEAPSHD